MVLMGKSCLALDKRNIQASIFFFFFFYFSLKTDVVGGKVLLMSTHNILFS